MDQLLEGQLGVTVTEQLRNPTGRSRCQGTEASYHQEDTEVSSNHPMSKPAQKQIIQAQWSLQVEPIYTSLKLGRAHVTTSRIRCDGNETAQIPRLD